MSCIRPQILSDEQQSTEIVLIEKISHENFGVQTFWNDSSVSYTFCSTHNFRIKSEVSAFLMRCEAQHLCSPSRTHLASILCMFFAVTKSVLCVAMI